MLPFLFSRQMVIQLDKMCRSITRKLIYIFRSAKPVRQKDARIDIRGSQWQKLKVSE